MENIEKSTEGAVQLEKGGVVQSRLIYGGGFEEPFYLIYSP